MDAKTLDQLFQQIALDHLFIDTLETRHSDRLDFHECALRQCTDGNRRARGRYRVEALRVNGVDPREIAHVD